MIRFYLDVDGYTDNWIEVEEKWTASEAKKADGVLAFDGFLELLQAKATGCNIILDGGEVVTSPKELTVEMITDRLNPLTYGFVTGILQSTTARLRSLGNVKARVSSSRNVGQN